MRGWAFHPSQPSRDLECCACLFRFRCDSALFLLVSLRHFTLCVLLLLLPSFGIQVVILLGTLALDPRASLLLGSTTVVKRLYDVLNGPCALFALPSCCPARLAAVFLLRRFAAFATLQCSLAMLRDAVTACWCFVLTMLRCDPAFASCVLISH